MKILCWFLVFGFLETSYSILAIVVKLNAVRVDDLDYHWVNRINLRNIVMKCFTLLPAFALIAPLASAGPYIDLTCQAGGRTAGYIKVKDADSKTGRVKLGYVPETVFLVSYTNERFRFIMASNGDIQIDLDGEGWARLYDYGKKSGDVKPEAVYKCE